MNEDFTEQVISDRKCGVVPWKNNNNNNNNNATYKVRAYNNARVIV